MKFRITFRKGFDEFFRSESYDVEKENILKAVEETYNKLEESSNCTIWNVERLC